MIPLINTIIAIPLIIPNKLGKIKYLQNKHGK